MCNRAYAAPLLLRVLRRVVVALGLAQLLDKAIAMLAANTHGRSMDRSSPD